MFFNTHEFLFAFLPLTLAGSALLLARGDRRYAIWWLVVCSCLFYLSLDGHHLLVLLGSAGANFAAARLIARWREGNPGAARALLCAGVLLDLGVFAFFKYAPVAPAQAGSWPAPAAFAIPLGLSFFTVQQILYLLSTYRENEHRPTLGEYLLFVTFFPYVVAGPMTRPGEILPQFREMDIADLRAGLLASATLFSMGLLKKAGIADNMAPLVDGVFGRAASDAALSTFDAWGGALLYTLQIYFDFSGYSDMAAGLAGMLGLRLPMNFNSPYKARSIMEFWQRWHMSMTRFFTDHVFLPLAVHFTRLVIRRRIQGLPQTLLRSALPLALTFFVVGLWHGAGANFAAFALLMSVAMAVNHAWEKYRCPALPGPLAWTMTMAVVVAGMVFDRSDDFATAWVVLGAMAGLGPAASQVLDPTTALAWIAAVGGIALAAPNTHQVMLGSPVVLPGHAGVHVPRWPGLRWSESSTGLVFTGCALCISVLAISKASQFIYYRF